MQQLPILLEIISKFKSLNSYIVEQYRKDATKEIFLLNSLDEVIKKYLSNLTNTTQEDNFCESIIKELKFWLPSNNIFNQSDKIKDVIKQNFKNHNYKISVELTEILESIYRELINNSTDYTSIFDIIERILINWIFEFTVATEIYYDRSYMLVNSNIRTLKRDILPNLYSQTGDKMYILIENFIDKFCDLRRESLKTVLDKNKYEHYSKLFDPSGLYFRNFFIQKL